MQCGNTVILLEILRLSADLRRIELDLLWIFFGFDFDEPLDWVFYRFGQVVQRFDFFAVHLRYSQIGEFIVANSAVSRKDLAENNNSLNSKRNNIAGVRVSREQIRELDLAVKRVHVVAVLIDFIVRDRSHDVTHLESRFHGWRAWLDSGYIYSAGVLPFFSGELTQRGIARGRE